LDVLFHLIIAVGRGTEMDFAAEIFAGEFCLMQTAGRGAGQVLATQAEGAPRGKAFERKQDFAPCPRLHHLQNLQILTQQAQINHITRRLYFIHIAGQFYTLPLQIIRRADQHPLSKICICGSIIPIVFAGLNKKWKNAAGCDRIKVC
jgi:hypothetical protein